MVARLEKDYYSGLSETSKQFLYAIIFVTAVMAVGGVFGVMNTMFAAISHRIKDIGVLRILGYARWHILVSFLLESLVIALIGGLAGCAIGSLFNGLSANSMVGSGNGGGKTVVITLDRRCQYMGGRDVPGGDDGSDWRPVPGVLRGPAAAVGHAAVTPRYDAQSRYVAPPRNAARGRSAAMSGGAAERGHKARSTQSVGASGCVRTSGKFMRRRFLIIFVVLAALAGGGWLLSPQPTGPAQGTTIEGQLARAASPVNSFRIGTFNIHGCTGTDGRRDVARVAECLADLDFVALQRGPRLAALGSRRPGGAARTAARRAMAVRPGHARLALH